MERSHLTEIILEQYKQIQEITKLTSREKLTDVIKACDLPHIIAITGLRRTGKSTLMLQTLSKVYNQQAYYLDFEDERLMDFKVSDFNLLYEIFIELFGERKVFFFDEIQIVLHWESFIRRMYKSQHKFIVSGSSAELLSSELSTKLTGRHIAIELLPFSFREYLDFMNDDIDLTQPRLTKERGLLKKAFNHFMENGGIPEYLKYQNPLILKGIYENILYKDVIVRYEIKAVKAMRELALWLLSNPGALISYSKLKHILQLGSINTVKNYIHYLENAYLIFTIDKYTYSVGEQTIAQKKAYIIDTGLMNHIGFQFSGNSGKYLENIVYLELRRHYSSEIFYYKTQEDLEIDFCLRSGQEITLLIQVTEHLNHTKTREREIHALIRAMDELKLKKGLIITLDNTEELEINGKQIHIVSIVDWLLNSSPF